MKRSFAILISIVILSTFGGALASTIDAIPLEVGETLDVDGLFSIQVASFIFTDEYKYYEESDGFYHTNHDKETSQYLQIEIDYMNLSLSEINIQKYLSGYVLYAEKYPFEGSFYQIDLNDNNRICYYSFPTGVLEEGRVIFTFEAPNILETSSDSLSFFITLDENEYVVKLR